jgi:hypothetical protein
MLDADRGDDASQALQGQWSTLGQDRVTTVRDRVERTLDVAQGCEHAGGVIGMHLRGFTLGITWKVLRQGSNA